MTTIKTAATELKSLVTRISKLDELLKDIKESDEGAIKLSDKVKEAQEDLKAYLAANLDYFNLTNEKNELLKELKQGCKAATKNTAFKPAMLVAFLKATVKEEAVNKTIDKGQLFNSLKSQTA
jgi:cysteinyl-tRNA synthetase